MSDEKSMPDVKVLDLADPPSAADAADDGDDASERDDAAKKKEANRKKKERAKAKKAAAKEEEGTETGRWKAGKLPGGRAERRNAGSDRGMGVFALEPVLQGEVIASSVPALSVIFDPAADQVCSFCFETPKWGSTTQHAVTMRTLEGSFGVVLDNLLLPGGPEEAPLTVVTRLTSESPNRGALRVGDRLVSIEGEPVEGGHAAAVPMLKAALAKGASEVRVVVARPAMLHCQGCKRVAVCEKCAGAGYMQWHNYECSLFQMLPGGATAGESATVRLLLRYKCSNDERIKEWTEGKEPVSLLQTLQGNAADVPPEQLQGLAKHTGISAAQASQLIYQVRTNACQVTRRGQKVGCALSCLMGWHNHDCNPSASSQVTSDGHVTVTALRDLREGEEITISYVNPADDVDERRRVLLAHYGFDCKCARCLAENRVALKQRMKERDNFLSSQRR